MLSCKETTRLLSESQDRPLGFKERIDLKLHLLMCQGCTHYREQIDFLRLACERLKNSDKESRP